MNPERMVIVADSTHQLEAVRARHRHVGHERVHRLAREDVQRLGTVACIGRAVADAGEEGNPEIAVSMRSSTTRIGILDALGFF